MSIFDLLSFGESKQLKQYRAKCQVIGERESFMQEKSNDELRAFADSLRERVAAGEDLNNLLVDAFALVREASVRTTGLRHYDVQLIGAMALHDGCIAEMKTGEGKTLVSTAACFLNALDGHNVHVVTVNDYLAKRDAEWMGAVHRLLGLEVGLIQNGMTPAQRKPAYQANITYGTNSEFGFDYLRDNMVGSTADRVQRGHGFAVVDEVDSILIDEARTPLIISGLGGNPADSYKQFAEIIPALQVDEDFTLDETKRIIYATEEGLDKVEAALGAEIYADETGRLANHLKQALRAEFLFHRDKEYVVMNGEVKIVDEFTGRIMDGRRYSEGLHQAIEAKEHVEIRAETQTLATVTLQNYFRLYRKLSGMTGTALTEDAEFRQIYNLPVVPVPTNKPVVRQDKEDLIFRTIEAKYNAVVDEVEKRNKKGQPVLVGTATIEGSERISAMLTERGVKHETLNAKNHEEEAEIIAQAGRLGAVTIATNMAGRGTDILLGGNREELIKNALKNHYRKTKDTAEDWQLHSAEGEANYIVDREGYAVRLFGGLFVLGTDRHESRRIDNQLRGRSGRQGDPGESQFFLSLEDTLMRRFGGDRLDAVSEMMQKQGLSDEVPLKDPLVSKVIGAAQQQVESLHFGARKNVLQYDDVMNSQRLALYEERNAILEGKDMKEHLPSIVDDLVLDAALFHCPLDVPSDDWDMDGLVAWAANMSGEDCDYIREIDHNEDSEELAREIAQQFKAICDRKFEVLGDEAFSGLISRVMLRMMDTRWVDHLHDMEYLKTGIGLRAIGYRDPLTEYREEAYDSFQNLISSVYEDLLQTILRLPVEIAKKEEKPAPVVDEDSPFNPENMIYSTDEDDSTAQGGGASMAPNDPIMGFGK